MTVHKHFSDRAAIQALAVLCALGAATGCVWSAAILATLGGVGLADWLGQRMRPATSQCMISGSAAPC